MGCALAGSLAQLDVAVHDTTFVLGSWADPALSRIQRLELTALQHGNTQLQPQLAVTASLHFLIRLMELKLWAREGSCSCLQM